MTTPALPDTPADIAARIRAVIADYTPKADEIGVSDGAYAGSLVEELLDVLNGFAEDLDRYQAAAEKLPTDGHQPT